MPRKGLHLKIATIAGASVSLISSLSELENLDDLSLELVWTEVLPKMAFWAFITRLFAMAPDWVEPAKHPGHRGFFHSVLFVVVLCVCYRYYSKSKIGKQQKQLNVVALLFVIAYVVHVGADSLTPASVRII